MAVGHGSSAGHRRPPRRRPSGHVKIGVLTCAAGVEVGLLITSGEKIRCSFVPDAAGTEHYHGKIRKFGLDIGITAASVIVWARARRRRHRSTRPARSPAICRRLGGGDRRRSASAPTSWSAARTRRFILQPLSIQGQAGLNLAVGVSDPSPRAPASSPDPFPSPPALPAGRLVAALVIGRVP